MSDHSAWQPIETAPKDGTEVQIWAAEWYPRARYGMRDGRDGWYEEYYNDDWRCYEKTPIYEASHWMPLPPTPGSAS